MGFGGSCSFEWGFLGFSGSVLGFCEDMDFDLVGLGSGRDFVFLLIFGDVDVVG